MAQRLSITVTGLSRLTGAGLIAVVLSAGSDARANLLVGDSSNSGLSNCVNVSGTPCGTNTATSLELSSFTLTVNRPFLIDVVGNTSLVPLAELTMTTGNSPTGQAQLGYNLKRAFTTPSIGSLATETFAITMMGSGSGSNSTVTLSGFTGLPSSLVLDGVTLSDFAFQVIPGTATSNFTGGAWTVTRGGGGPGTAASLELVADVTATPVSVPEPATLALVGSALAGIGLMRRRKRN